MRHHIAYYQVYTADQSIEAQRAAMGGTFDQEYSDQRVEGGGPAADLPGFASMLAAVRSDDIVHVYAVDRLGRDALEVQATLGRLLGAGVTVDIHGLGPIGRGAGELILAVLTQVAEMERRRTAERTEAGRQAARASLRATGRTHRGKKSLGRPFAADPAAVRDWRRAKGASIAETARRFGVSQATVKRYCAAEKL